MYAPQELVRTLDELIRTDLESLRDAYFVWLLISAGAVALGVVLEGPELAHQTKQLFRPDAKRESTPTWIVWVGLIGWVLVVAGVAGEGIDEGLVSKADVLLQTFNDTLLSDTQQKSDEANERAATLTKVAEDERLARVQIEQSLAARKLSRTDSDTLVRRAKNFQGQTVILKYQAGDWEAGSFAWDIAKALHRANWNVYSPSSSLYFAPGNRPYDTGLGARLTGVIVSSNDNRRSAADALVNALRQCGFDARFERPNKQLSQQDVVVVFAGARPDGPQGTAKLRNGEPFQHD